LQVKFWETLEDVESKINVDKVFEPSISKKERDEKL
jgi:glycerol kinase